VGYIAAHFDPLHGAPLLAGAVGPEAEGEAEERDAGEEQSECEPEAAAWGTRP
jgi:hypothetical protein